MAHCCFLITNQVKSQIVDKRTDQMKPKENKIQVQCFWLHISPALRTVLHHSVLPALSNSFSLSFLFLSNQVSFAKSDMPSSSSSFHFSVLWLIVCLIVATSPLAASFRQDGGLDFPFTLWQHQFSSPVRWCESNCTFSFSLSVNVMLGWNSQ